MKHLNTYIQNSHKKGIHSKYFGIRNIWQLETDATIPLPFLPLQAFPPGLTSLTPRQPAKYLNLFASFFSLFLGKVKVFLVALSSSLSRDYYKHLSGPLLVFGVAWLSQAFCCSNIAAKISVNLCLECDLMKMPPLSNNLCFCWNIVLVFLWVWDKREIACMPSGFILLTNSFAVHKRSLAKFCNYLLLYSFSRAACGLWAQKVSSSICFIFSQCLLFTLCVLCVFEFVRLVCLGRFHFKQNRNQSLAEEILTGGFEKPLF